MRSFALVGYVVFLFAIQWHRSYAVRDLLPRATGDLCFLWGHRVAIVGDRLFFMDGNYTFVSTDPIALPQPYLFYLDLDKDFNVEQFITSDMLQKYSLPSTLAPNPAIGSEDSGQILWYGNDTLYVPDSLTSVATFDTTTNSWGSAGVSGSDVNFAYSGNYSSEMSASVPRSGLSFSFGLTGIPGIVRFNASTPNSFKWANQTTGGTSEGIQVPLVGESEMVYLPMGEEGVLLLMGGFDASVGSDPQMIPFSQISVYDIASSAWYAVTATGDSIPASRGQFCAVVSESPDQSSFQVTIYGGWDPTLRTDYEDVFVLAVPSFRWIRVNATNDFESQAVTNIGRAHHRCAMYKDAQMIVLGGSIRFGTADQTNETACNSAYPPIRVLDTSTYIWKKVFDPTVTYSVPYIVTDVIGGDASGNANLTGPEGGFNFTALQTIFSQRYPQIANQTSGISSPSTHPSSSPSPSASPSPSHSYTGAIAGGIVGGLISLTALVGLFLVIRARRRGQARNETLEQSWQRKELPADSMLLTNRPAKPPYQVFEMDSSRREELDSVNRLEMMGSHGGTEMEAPARTAQT